MQMRCKNRTEVVRSVNVLLEYLKPDSPWTIVIRRDKSGDCFVSTVTDTSSEGIQEKVSDYLDQHVRI